MGRLDLAIIGGSGMYHFPGLEDIQRHVIETPYGKTSDDVVIGLVAGKRVAFLARHGQQHHLLPHQVNYRANLWALHHLGARQVVGVNAVGGIRADMGPLTIVVPDQIIDYTYGRQISFYELEDVRIGHIDFSEPYTESLRQRLLQASDVAKVPVIAGGCYGATQGPRLETRAEIARMQRDGCDLVGMTGMPEAVLARELDVAYACLALVVNFAAGCGEEAQISIEEISANLAIVIEKVPRIMTVLLS